MTENKIYLKKEDITFNELIDKAKAIQECCFDITIPGATLGKGSAKRSSGIKYPGLTSAAISKEGMYGTLTFVPPTNPLGLPFDMKISASMSEWSLAQLCSVRLGIPAQYMLKCLRSKEPDIQDLFEKNINEFLKLSDSGVKLRMYNQTIRAVVSDRYTCFDSFPVLQTVKNMVDGDKFSIRGHQINEEGMQLRMTTKEPLNIEGEDLYPGFIITSGDVGNRSLMVQLFIWKQICTNGLMLPKVAGKILHKRHFGCYDESDFQESLEEALEVLPTFTRRAKELIVRTKAHPLSENDFEKAMKDFQKEVKLKKEEEQDISDKVKVYGFNLFGFANALTEFAQNSRFDLDDRMKIEEYAGDFLTRESAKLQVI